jgi:hypothetical protein
VGTFNPHLAQGWPWSVGVGVALEVMLSLSSPFLKKEVLVFQKSGMLVGLSSLWLSLALIPLDTP